MTSEAINASGCVTVDLTKGIDFRLPTDEELDALALISSRSADRRISTCRFWN
jgi:hypothetical protein